MPCHQPVQRVLVLQHLELAGRQQGHLLLGLEELLGVLRLLEPWPGHPRRACLPASLLLELLLLEQLEVLLLGSAWVCQGQGLPQRLWPAAEWSLAGHEPPPRLPCQATSR